VNTEQVAPEQSATELLTIDDLMLWLKFSRQQVYSLTRHRSRVRQSLPIPFLKINGNIRFQRTSVSRWLDQLAAEGGD
jgi:predicted DNA-binding transcriptional regulator AlpA